MGRALQTCALICALQIGLIYGAVDRYGVFSMRFREWPRGRTRGFGHEITILTENGKECKFPFRFGGQLHFSCTSIGPVLRKWCATTHNYDRDKEWGYCVSVIVTDVQDHCIWNPCLNGGTCNNALDRSTYYCVCPDDYTGEKCEKRRCFDEAHYEFYDSGESWARIHRGRVEQCTCDHGVIDCHRGERFTVCTENPCLNGGACRLMISTGQAVCACRGKYVGKYCNIDVSHQCYDHDNATEYRGIVKKTQSEHYCLPWDSDLFHQEIHTGTVVNFASRGLGSHAYCRSPDKDANPWCYIMKDNHISWEYCPVPSCHDKSRRVVMHNDDEVLASKPKCGKKHEKRVVARGRILSGTSALPASHPWLAAIYIGNSFCSGSLIQSCWVVSAAHCFAHSPSKSSIKVVLGQHFYNQTTDVTQTFEIERYIFHSKYSVFQPTEHDIVLIRLKRVNNVCAKRTQFVQPICLPDEGVTFEDGHYCAIAGWGRMKEDATDYAYVLQEAVVPLVPYSKCSSPEVHGFDISENMVCAGYFDCNIDACQGDSGGALACEKDKISYLYGIISWGDGCGRVNKPGVYTRVSNYVEWIRGKIMPKRTEAATN
ncbi:hepatocyte growth factor activator [Spea bombifrons]|uniref:hepatocyte growth factor activator n=1 Tax=Spea bombifrons TaxID=233779 RepID=UPI00234920AF|nr:hepatocyte growth factor activator [Spea bombifrons]